MSRSISSGAPPRKCSSVRSLRLVAASALTQIISANMRGGLIREWATSSRLHSLVGISTKTWRVRQLIPAIPTPPRELSRIMEPASKGCLMATQRDLDAGITWRKSSFSADQGCVEVTAQESLVLVRDSRGKSGVMLRVSLEGWSEFLDYVRGGISRGERQNFTETVSAPRSAAVWPGQGP